MRPRVLLERLPVVRRCDTKLDSFARHWEVETDKPDDMLSPPGKPPQIAFVIQPWGYFAACLGHGRMIRPHGLGDVCRVEPEGVGEQDLQGPCVFLPRPGNQVIGTVISLAFAEEAGVDAHEKIPSTRKLCAASYPPETRRQKQISFGVCRIFLGDPRLLRGWPPRPPVMVGCLDRPG